MHALEDLYPYCSRDTRRDADRLVQDDIDPGERHRIAQAILGRLDVEKADMEELIRASSTLRVHAQLRDRLVGLATEHKLRLGDIAKEVSGWAATDDDKERMTLAQIEDDLRAANAALDEVARATTAGKGLPTPEPNR